MTANAWHDVEELVLLTGVIVFLITTMVFLFNMFITPLTCEYASIAMDMQAYARLERRKNRGDDACFEGE